MPHRRLLLLCLVQCGVANGFSVQPKSPSFLPERSGLDNNSNPSIGPSLVQPYTNGEASTNVSDGTTAIILNTNARSVTKDLEPLAASIFGTSHVFCTTTEVEAKQAADHIVQNLQSYKLVVPVGGDGTLASMINYLCDSIGGDVDEAMGKLPLIGYIPLGTGNGVGSVIGCRLSRGLARGTKRRKRKRLEHIMNALRRVGQGTLPKSNDFEVVEMPMMEVTHPVDGQVPTPRGDLCFFAGVGFDSLMLNDFKNIKAWSHKTGILRDFLGSVAGYCVALVVKTLPKCLVRGEHNIRVELTSNDPDCVWVDHRRGDMVRPCGEAKLYEGTTGILAAGTSPFYGGGLRLFPFARMTLDKMHLRLGRIHPVDGFVNIPSIFAGSYRDKSDRFGCLDFIGDDFEVRVQSTTAAPNSDGRGYPFQHSGESIGHVERFRLRVVKNSVRFVSFLKPRLERDD